MKKIILILIITFTVNIIYSSEANQKEKNFTKNKITSISFNFNKNYNNDLIEQYKSVKKNNPVNIPFNTNENVIGSAIFLIIIIAIGLLVGIALFLGALIPSIIFSAFYVTNYWNREYSRTGMFASGSILFVLLSALVTAIESIFSFIPHVPAIIAPVSGLFALSGLISASILTYLYVNNINKSEQIITGMFWSWGMFGVFIIPAIVGLIIGIVYGSQSYKYKEKEEKNLSLDIRENEIGIRYRF